MAVALVLGPLHPATASPDPGLEPAASADAYGLDVQVSLSPLDVRVEQGPLARATQDSPPPQQQAPPAEAQVLGAGPFPAGGELVDEVGVASSLASATGEPRAQAVTEVSDVALLSQGGTALITATQVRASATSDCSSAPSAVGTQFVNLRVGGIEQAVDAPAPNTELLPAVFNPLGLRVVLNEQHPAADGRGLVVNALHVYSVVSPTFPALFEGDLVVAHAMSTVHCPNGMGSTGGANGVYLTKTASPSVVLPGQQVTYTAVVENRSSAPCGVNRLIDHLPVPFELASTSGNLGPDAGVVARPGGGADVELRPVGVVIAAGGSVQQVFVARVPEDAAPGTYFNNVEVFCSGLGNWVKGLDAPVQVTDGASPSPSPALSPRVTPATPAMPATEPGTPGLSPPRILATTGLPSQALGWAGLTLLALAAAASARARSPRPRGAPAGSD